MIRLDKTNDEAIQHVARFIENQWRDDADKYTNISYNDIEKSKYREFCLKEQNNVCCYCSRQIVDSPAETELEHIIPQAVKDEITLNCYFEHSDILASNIVLQDLFKAAQQRQTLPPFPHHIAYHNIVASCNGKTFTESDEFTCCNRKRKNDFIPPFNVMEDCIKYLPDGTVLYSKDITKLEYIVSLNLNKQVLKDIRRLWFLLAKSDIPLEEIQQAKTESDYLRILTVCIATSRFKRVTDDALRLSFITRAKWNVFITFQYFYHFFGNPRN